MFFSSDFPSALGVHVSQNMFMFTKYVQLWQKSNFVLSILHPFINQQCIVIFGSKFIIFMGHLSPAKILAKVRTPPLLGGAKIAAVVLELCTLWILKVKFNRKILAWVRPSPPFLQMPGFWMRLSLRTKWIYRLCAACVKASYLKPTHLHLNVLNTNYAVLHISIQPGCRKNATKI